MSIGTLGIGFASFIATFAFINAGRSLENGQRMMAGAMSVVGILAMGGVALLSAAAQH